MFQQGRGGVVEPLHRGSCFAGGTDLRSDRLHHGAPQFQSKLIETVQSPQKALNSGPVFVQSQQLSQGEGIEFGQEYRGTGSIASEHHVFAQRLWGAFLDHWGGSCR